MNVYNGTQNCKRNEEIKKNVRENCKPRNDKVHIYLTREKYIANHCAVNSKNIRTREM